MRDESVDLLLFDDEFVDEPVDESVELFSNLLLFDIDVDEIFGYRPNL